MPRIRPLTEGDWPEVRAIYTEGIATGNATFETEVPTWQEFDRGHLASHRLVAVEGGRVVGWAALSSTSWRACYAGVVEHSIYVAAGARGRGIGGRLLEALVRSADRAGIWTIQTSVFPENEASVRLHLRAGFRVRGTPRADRAARRRLARHAPPRAARVSAYAPSLQRRSTTHALWPPNPNPFETPISTCCSRATFGM